MSTISEALYDEFARRSRSEENPIAAAGFAVAAAISAAACLLGHEFRLLTVGTPGAPGAIEDQTRHLGEQIDALTEAIRDGLGEIAAARRLG